MKSEDFQLQLGSGKINQSITSWVTYGSSKNYLVSFLSRSEWSSPIRWQNIDASLATRKHEQTGKMAFFNNMVSRYLNAIKAGSLEPPYLNKKGKLQPPALVNTNWLSHIRSRINYDCSMATELKFHISI
jgi:hypothetical protein